MSIEDRLKMVIGDLVIRNQVLMLENENMKAALGAAKTPGSDQSDTDGTKAANNGHEQH